MTRLVVPFGFYGAGNIGDEATLHGFARLVQSRATPLHVSVGSRDPRHTRRVEPSFSYFSVTGSDPRRWLSKLRASAQAVIGGTPIMDVEGRWPLNELTPLLRATDRWKVPCAFVGVGVQGLHSLQSRLQATTEIVPRVCHWSVRSEQDRGRLLSLGASPSDVTVAADLAWLIEPADQTFGHDVHRRLGLGPGGPIVGVNVVNENYLFDRDPSFVVALAKAFDALVDRWSARVLFLSNEVRKGDTFDTAAAGQVIAKMVHRDRTFLASNGYLSPREMMSIVACCDLTVSMRYHFCVFSALQRVPFVAIERTDKLSDLCWDMSWSARLSPVGLEAADLVEHASRLYEDRAGCSSVLKTAVEAMARRAFANGAPLDVLIEEQSSGDWSTGRRAAPTVGLAPNPAPGVWTTQLKRLYLSEMPVSNGSACGVTLQKVLQGDMATFDVFVHLADASRDEPVIESCSDRQYALHEIGDPWWLRSAWDHWCERVGIASAARASRARQIRHMAEHAVSSFPSPECEWLVVPRTRTAVHVMNAIWRRRSDRYLVWIMDDEYVTWQNGWHYPSDFEAEFRFHLQHAAHIFVGSPALKQLYAERFGVTSEILLPPTEVLEEPVYQGQAGGDDVRLAHFGPIGPWQFDALERLVSNLEPAGATLDLFGLSDLPESLRSDRVRAHPSVPPDVARSRMRHYDGVVITASFKPEFHHRSALTVPVELSECYASGTVTVVIAPPYSAVSQFVQLYGGGLAVGAVADAVERQAIRRLKSDSTRRPILEVARQVWHEQCASAVMHRRWRDAWSGETRNSHASNTPSRA